MTNELKKAPTKDLSFTQVEIAFLLKIIETTNDDFWYHRNNVTFEDLETLMNIKYQILNTAYNENN